MFFSLLKQKDYEKARALMAPDPRRWREAREGAGQPWRIGPDQPDRWAAWDEHFRSQEEHNLVAEAGEWREGARSATLVMRETNDYFRNRERMLC
jgi:hypothetical protein